MMTLRGCKVTNLMFELKDTGHYVGHFIRNKIPPYFFVFCWRFVTRNCIEELCIVSSKNNLPFIREMIYYYLRLVNNTDNLNE